MDFGSGNTHRAFDSSTLAAQYALDHVVPYAILLINCLLFKILRNLINRLASTASTYLISNDGQQKISTGRTRLVKLFIDELISTCELCADCAELNVVYEKHGSYAYGLTLFVLSYLWIESFGDAYTSPGYLAEEYFLIEGNSLLKTGDAYARFIGQSLAMPLAWRVASIYWKYNLIREHTTIADIDNCKSSLATSTTNGFLIELACCFLCRLTELVGHSLLERRHLSQRVVSALCSFISALLVVFALESSGGYFHPILAASLEYGCKGIDFHQHALVFWLGPLLGHLMARGMFRGLESVSSGADQKRSSNNTSASKSMSKEERRQQIHDQVSSSKRKPHLQSGAAAAATVAATNGSHQQVQQSKRMTRSNSQRSKKLD